MGFWKRIFSWLKADDLTRQLSSVIPLNADILSEKSNLSFEILNLRKLNIAKHKARVK